MSKIILILDKIKKEKTIRTDIELANILRVRPNTISTWRKRGTVPYKTLIAFCEQKGIDIKDLLSEEEKQMGKDVYDQEGIGPGMTFENIDKYSASQETSMDKKLNIDDAMGKGYKILSSGTPYAVALYLNIMQFASALDVGRELEKCVNEIQELKSQVNELRQ